MITDKPRNPYLTKSRFKLALECLTKLYYTGKNKEYADENLNDPFLIALAKGGFQVGELAKFYFSDDPIRENMTIETLNSDVAVEETQKRLEQPGKVVIAEGAFRYGNLLIRADIVVKDSDTLFLYEVKAKSADDTVDNPDTFLTKKGDRIASDWISYLYDLAFQKYVISKCPFSKRYKIKAHLLLADKDAQTDIEGLNQLFKIEKETGRGYKVLVPEGITKASLGRKILKEINLDSIVDKIWNEFPVPSDYSKKISFLDFINLAEETYTKGERKYTPIGSKCKGCQFYAQPGQTALKSGFHECWQKHTNYSANLLNKPLVTELWSGLAGGVSLVQKLIDNKVYLLENAENKLSPPASANNKKEGLTAYERRIIQIRKVKTNDYESFINLDGLKNEMQSWKYPLHMIDFETSMVALPFHKGLKPYQGVAFQFSHHVMHKDGTVEHKGEFLETEPGKFPNYDFVRALKKELETDEGTIFRYHNHENAYLNLIAGQLERNSNVPDDKEELIQFIKKITRIKVNDEYEYGPRDMVDLYDLVLRYYYNPLAKGSNSLKQILPAIIADSEYLRDKYGKPGVYGKNLQVKSLNFDDHVWIRSDKNLDPYKTLPPVFDGLDRNTLDNLVKDFEELGDGGAALTAYNYLQYADVPKDQRQRIAEALLRYCELDTMAMIMIVEGWKSMMR
jgi:hypothetical protein